MRNSSIRKAVLQTLSGMLVVMLAMMVSCSKDPSADLKDILRTVPSDAAAVTVFDIHSLVEKAGGKVNGDKIELSGAMTNLLQHNADQEVNATINAMMAGDAGIEFGVSAVFVEGKSQYFVGMLSNPDNFKTFCEKQLNGQFTDQEGVQVLNYVAYKDNLFWIDLRGGNSVNGQTITRFSALTDQQSFLSNPISSKMEKLEEDIIFWGNFNGLFNLGKSGFGSMAIYRMALSSVFDDAQEIFGTVDFEKGKAEGDLQILNSKGKPAKFLLPAVKIDEGTVKKLGDSADVVAAFAINQKLISKIEELLNSFGGEMPSLYKSALTPLDGTLCCAATSDGNNISGIVSTTGEGTATISAFLNNFGNVTKDGKLLKVNKGDVRGPIKVAEAASKLHDAMLGIVIANPEKMGNSYGQSAAWAKCVTVCLEPDGGSMELKITADAVDSNVNVLESIVKESAGAGK